VKGGVGLALPDASVKVPKVKTPALDADLCHDKSKLNTQFKIDLSPPQVKKPQGATKKKGGVSLDVKVPKV
jgi:hypothetical protein